ncbi:unnamed protein product [Closterium sp. Naga37s-1]|nr:unnamed protein product [Closterium sp. Naga37s-1]
MIRFLRIHQGTRAFLRSPELHDEKALQALRPACTRFGSQYDVVSRLCKIHPQLMQMVVYDDWKGSGRKATEEQFEGWVMDGVWWKKAEFFVQVMELPFIVMRRTNSEAKGMMGAIYNIMLQPTDELTTLLDSEECRLKEEETEEGYKLEEDGEVEVDEDDVCVDEYMQGEGKEGGE